jgi:hypothetical protein
MTGSRTQQEKNVRRTILILCAVALAFYIGFILMGVLRA